MNARTRSRHLLLPGAGRAMLGRAASEPRAARRRPLGLGPVHGRMTANPGVTLPEVAL